MSWFRSAPNKVQLSAEAVKLLNIYAEALEIDLSVRLTTDQAAERVIRIMLEKNLEKVINARAESLGVKTNG